MKKFLLIAVAAFGMLMTACSKDEVAQPVAEKSTVTFSVAAPELATRAEHGDGTLAKNLTYAVYNRADGAKLFDGTATMDAELKATVEIPFVNGMTYDVLFWAESENSPYLVNWTAKTVGYNPAVTLVSNSKDYDAFYAYVNDIPEITGPVTKTVELKRPFAQLNIKTNDAAKAAQSGVVVEEVKVVVKKGYSSFDLVDGTGEDQGDVTFGFATTETTTDLLAVNYLFTGGEKSLVDVEFTYTDENNNVSAEGRTMEFASVPVQRNYRTNIVGSLLTSDGTFNVEIKKGFETTEHNVDVVTVASAQDLADAFDALNDDDDTNDPDQIILTGDIDLNDLLGTRAETIKNGLTIAKNKKVTLDLGGYTLSFDSEQQGASMIVNNGDLTISNGNVAFLYKGQPDTNYGKGNYTISNSGKLTINGATVSVDVVGYENDKFPHALYAVQTNGEVVINDGSKIVNDHNIALRIFANVSPAHLTINGGELKGLRAIWLQLPSADATKAPEVNVNINGGKIIGTAVDGTKDSDNILALYSYSYGNSMQNVEINITGGEFTGDIALTGGANKSAIETLNITGGTFNGLWGDVYSYGEDALAAEAITIKGGEFSTLYPMVYLDSAEEVLTLAEDIALEEALTFNGEGTLDLNGKTLSAVSTQTGTNYNMIDVRGTLTVANGTITTKHEGQNMGWNNSTNVFNVTAGGVLNLESVVAKNLGGSDMAFVAHLNNWGEVTLNVNNSTLESPYVAVRVFNSGYDMNNVTIKNSTLKAKNSVWVHNYTAADFGTQDKADAQKALLNFDILNGTNTFEYTAAAVRLGMTNSTYLIDNAVGLKYVAEQVNSGASYYKGSTIKLIADIDLNNEEWTPIGSFAQEHGFMGNFDGNGKVIKNLKISNISLDADNYAYAGLFGLTEGVDANNENYIKNLVIENVNISTEGHIAAAAIAYPYYTNIENVLVKGNVTIKGGNYTSGVLAYTRRCVNAKDIAIAANEGSSIEGDQTIGGVISDIQMNGGLKANYSNFAASGLTIKGNKCVGGISGIISQQALNGATVKNVTIVCDDARRGIISGADGGNYTITNPSYENVTGADTLVGAEY